DLVVKMAPQYQIEPQLALAIIAAESNFNPQALSPMNAQGLMQLIPATSERFNVQNPYDPAQNIRGGLRYLRWLLAYFEGDIALVAAAYNAGEGKVERYRGVPPYLETRAYVKRILKSVGSKVHPFDQRAARPSRALERIRVTLREK
nr:lytic transglycosylase domain-containing protein [Giesbergeria sp.]